MLSLDIHHILNLHTDIKLQEDLTHASALDLDIDADIFFNNDIEPARYSANLIQTGLLLTRNTGLNQLTCKFASNSSFFIEDPFILGLFQALGSIPNPIDKLNLQFDEYAFSSVFLEPDNEFQEAIINIVKTKPAFQSLQELKFWDNKSYVESSIQWTQFLEKLFCALPNKSTFTSLSLQCNSCHFNADDRLKNAVEECKQLSQLEVISDELGAFIGKFIQSHQTLKNISVNVKYSTNNLAFLTEALSNNQLNDVSLALSLSFLDYYQTTGLTDQEKYENERNVIALLAKQIRNLIGLSRLQLKVKVKLNSSFQSLAPTLFIPIISNPTLSILTIDIDDLYLDIPMKNLLLKNKTLKSITTRNLNENEVHSIMQEAEQLQASGRKLSDWAINKINYAEKKVSEYNRRKEDADFLNRLTQRNRRLSNFCTPFFRPHAPLESLPSSIQNQLINLNSVWLSLMASYSLFPPANKILQDFNRDYFMLVCHQFFNQISSHRLNALPQDVCHIIAEYTDLPTIAKLNTITGGYFFRQAKPLSTHPHAVSMVSAHAENEAFHMNTR